jgi:hypothetical protein
MSSASFSVVSGAVEELTGRPATSVRDLFEANRAELVSTNE